MAAGDGRSSGGRLHVVTLPWLAVGHLFPFFELSKQIAERGHRVSFLCTPDNIKRLPPLPPHLSALLALVALPLPVSADVPNSAESTIDLPSQEHRPLLSLAYDQLQHQLRSFLRGSSPRPDWIVFDYAPYWAPRVAAEFGIPCAYFSIFSAATLAFVGPPSELKAERGPSRSKPEDYIVPPKWVTLPTTIAFRLHEAKKIQRVPDTSGVSESFRFGASFEECDLVAVRSCPEFEREWLDLLGDLFKKPIVPIGLMPPPSRRGTLDGSSTLAWLDEQKEGSVVYAAFGSEAKFTAEEVREIAVGLELSGLPFIWALRAPSGGGDSGGATALPDGFAGRVEGRGMVCFGWAPQVEILSHAAVGGFLSHGGWSSIVEGLAAGVVFALLPLMFDQGLNSRNLVERGVGLEVRRSEYDGSFAGRDIAEALRVVMVGREGETLRAKAKEAGQIFGNEEMQGGHMGDFVNFLMDNRKINGAQEY